MTDYQRIRAVLNEVQATHRGEFDTCLADEGRTMHLDVELYALGKRSIILMHEKKSGGITLYAFIGRDGDPVERDIQFLRDLAENPDTPCGLTQGATQ